MKAASATAETSPTTNAKLFLHDPAFPQWLKDVQAQPAEKQLDAVSKKLVELNPGFDGKLFQFYNDGIPQGVPKIENGVVTELHFFTKRVTDISPVRALQGLKVLSAIIGEGELTDISALQGMQLTTLFLWGNAKLSDLSPLAGMPLTFLIADGTSVSDLSPLKGMKFTVLRFAGTKVTDFSLIREMPLKDLNCNFQPERDTELLKSIKTLERINGKPAAEFWKEVEQQK